MDLFGTAAAPPPAVAEAPTMNLPALSEETVSAIEALEVPADDANMPADDADIAAAVEKVVGADMQAGGATSAEVLEERKKKAEMRHASRKAAAEAIATKVNSDSNALVNDPKIANAGGFKKAFFLGVVALLSGGPAGLAGRELLIANSAAASQQTILADVCSTSAASTSKVQLLQTEYDVLKGSNLGLGPLMGTQQQQQELDYAKLVATMNERMCTDKRATYAVAVAAVAAARTNAVTASVALILSSVGAGVAAMLTAGVKAVSSGDASELRALVNKASEAPQTPASSRAPMNPAQQDVVVPAFPDLSLMSPAPAPARGGRRTYRKAKRSGKTRKGRR
jgi:hypothetical protein